MIFNLDNEAFGLDISDAAIKIAKLKRKNGRFALSCFGEKNLDDGIVKGGEVMDVVALSEAIKKIPEFATGEKINTKYVALSLPEEETFLRIIRLPKMSLPQAKKAAIFEAENHIPVPIIDTYIDCEIFPTATDNQYLEALIVATPKKIIDAYAKAVELAGYTPVVFETENQATARAIIKGHYSQEPVLIVDFGLSHTNFSIFYKSSLRFGGVISDSLHDLCKIIAKELKIDIVQAKDLKHKFGLVKDGGKGEEMLEVANPLLRNMVAQIKKYINFYSAKNEDGQAGTIKKIYLCGYGASLKGVEEFFEESLGLPVEIGNPWINILPEDKKEIPMVDYGQSLELSAVLGLALRGINFEKENYD